MMLQRENILPMPTTILFAPEFYVIQNVVIYTLH